MFLKPVALACLLMLFAIKSFAVRAGNSEFFLSDGIVSLDQFKGINGESKMAVPNQMTGAVFITYRYFLADDIAIGIAAGFDNEIGDLTEGNPKSNGGNEGSTGIYTRNVYTIAPEFFVKYYGHKVTMLYGYGGLGYTSSLLNKYYDNRLFNNSFKNGVNTLAQTNPEKIDDSHITFQFTPIGIRVGRTVAVFFEVGFGYKGLFNGGLSVKL